MKRREEMTSWEKIYIPEIVKGLQVNRYHLGRNLVINAAHLFGLAKSRRAFTTVQYPEERKRYSDHYRGSHRLTLRENGAVRCTACYLCVYACPCDAIRMDTYVHPRIWCFDRKDFVETKEMLMHRSRVIAEKGREGNMEEMQAWYREQEAQVYNPERPELKTYTERALPRHYAQTEPSPEIPAIDRHHARSGN